MSVWDLTNTIVFSVGVSFVQCDDVNRLETANFVLYAGRIAARMRQKFLAFRSHWKEITGQPYGPSNALPNPKLICAEAPECHPLVFFIWLLGPMNFQNRQ